MEEIVLKASLEELPKVAIKVIEWAKASSFIAFRGDLGAGKTTLIKNICNLLNVKDQVNSPTFSLVNEYLGRENEVIYHFDFYRIEEEEEALDMGCEDYFYSGKLCLVEWPEKVENLLPKDRIEIEITLDGKERAFNIKRQINV